MRYLDIHEDDLLDEAQMATWIRQAGRLDPVAPAVARQRFVVEHVAQPTVPADDPASRGFPRYARR